jgi:hypothetical protein
VRPPKSATIDARRAFLTVERDIGNAPLDCDLMAASSPRRIALADIMLAAMRNREVFGAGLLIVLSVTLFGCTTPSPEPTNATDVDRAESITTIDDGIAWARGLDDDTTAEELTVGISRIGDLVIASDMPAEEGNAISSALLELNTEVLADPDDVDDHVEDLNEIVDDLEAAIEPAS